MSENTSGELREQVDALVGEWLAIPDVAEELDVPLGEVRRMLSDGQLVAVRRGRPRVLSIPAVLVRPEPLTSFAGTWTLLLDSGFDELDALRWLFSTDEGRSPIELLRAGHKTEVRRRAQALAF